MDTYLDMTKDQYAAIKALPIDEPMQMLNLLKFRKTLDENGMSGEDDYNTYSKAAYPFLKKVNAVVMYYGAVQLSLIGPESEWDKVMIVSYPSKKAFLNMIQSEGYPAHLRNKALADSRLILCLAS